MRDDVGDGVVSVDGGERGDVGVRERDDFDV